MNNRLKKSLPYIFLSVFLLVHWGLLIKLIFFPYPELFIYPYLTNNGLKPYSQILDQHFPGLMFLPVNFDNLGMNNEVYARGWLIGIVLITHLLLFFISRYIFKNSYRALLVNFLYLVWQPFFEGWVLWIDNFLPLLLLPAFYCILRKKFFLAGILIGLGIVFKQTIIPLSFLIFIYILFSERNYKKLINYMAGAGLPVAIMLLYIIWSGVFVDFWYWTIVFNLTVYSQTGTQIPQSIGFISRVLLVYISSLTSLLHKDKRLKIILLLFLIGSLAGAFDRANFVHFQPSLPFAIFGTAIGLLSLTRKSLSLLLIGVYLSITIWWQNIFYKGHLSSKVFFFDQSTYKLAEKVMEYTNAGDKIFLFGVTPHLYQMSGTLPSADVFVFQFPWFLKVSGNRILEGLKNDKPEIVVSDRSSEIEGEKLIDYAKEIDQYIQENYQKIDNVGSAEILRKKS